jgi:hypothetical protein
MAMIAGFLVTMETLPNITFPRDLRIRVLYTPNFKVPGPSYFYANAWNFELSQPVLYHNLGTSIQNAKKADILFIGNSRLQLGIREEFILPLAQKSNLKVFSIGCGHAEGTAFALDLIRKHDLRPKIVVIFGGAHIYNGGYSDVARETEKMSRWAAVKLWGETAASWNTRYRLHKAVPKVDFFDQRISSRYVVYRSEVTGWWKPALERGGTYQVSYLEGDFDYSRILPLATEIKSELDRRGSLLIASVIPYRRTDDQYLQYLKDKLAIPFVNPRLPDLETADGSHLNLRSAERFTKAFWQEFIAEPEVRKRLGLKSMASDFM